MTDTQRAIHRLRAIEAERELTAREERTLVGLLKCAAEDDEDDRQLDLPCGAIQPPEWMLGEEGV